MIEKRFTIDFENRVITDTTTTEVYSTLIQFKELLNVLNDENEQLKSKLSDEFNQSICITVQKSVINDLKKENEQLKSEINMLKTTIGRNERYIDRLTHKGEWR